MTMKAFLIITTLFYLGGAFKLSDDLVFPQIRIVNSALESFQRQTRQAAGNVDQTVQVLFLVGDTNSNGLISSSELANFLTTFAGLSSPTATQVSTIFVQFGDQNGDGELSRQEYRAVATMIGNRR